MPRRMGMEARRSVEEATGRCKGCVVTGGLPCRPVAERVGGFALEPDGTPFPTWVDSAA